MEPKDVTCFLPIEVKARELDTKIYLAMCLVEEDFLLIGAKPQVHKHMLSYNKPFIYFSKGINPHKCEPYNVIKFSKGLMVEIQEEGNISKLRCIGNSP